MIGFYNYTVILTYMGFISGILGIIAAVNGNLTMAITALMFSGLCDMFDGKIASTKKRNHDELTFGIQIDSLSDLVCFGVLPSIIGYSLGMNTVYYLPLLTLFPLAGLIRLAYFNVLETKKIKFFSKEPKEYLGLPITSTAFFLPLLYAFKPFFPNNFVAIYTLAMTMIGLLFVTKFKIPKLTMKELLLLLITGLIILGFILGN